MDLKGLRQEIDKEFKVSGDAFLQPRKTIPTTFLALNRILGGGIPCPAIVEVFGPPSSGKSALGFLCVEAFQKAGYAVIFFDTEASFEEGFVKIFNIDLDRLLLFDETKYTLSVEFVTESIIYTMKKLVESENNKGVLFVWDSVAGSVCQRDLDNSSEMAQRAQTLSQAFRVISSLIRKTNATLFCINQTRDTMEMFSRRTTTPGGNALKFHAHTRMELRETKIVYDSRKNVTGVVGGIRTVKNKTYIPFKECEFSLDFARGFDPFASLADVLYKDGVVEKRGSWYVYQYDDGKGMKELKFRASDVDRLIKLNPGILNGG